MKETEESKLEEKKDRDDSTSALHVPIFMMRYRFSAASWLCRFDQALGQLSNAVDCGMGSKGSREYK